MSEHTPTPWELGNVEGDGRRNQKVRIIRPVDDRSYEYGAVCYVFGDESKQTKDNAEFIVRACNAHDDLVKVADLLKQLDDKDGLSSPALGYIRDRAIAALDKAGAA